MNQSPFKVGERVRISKFCHPTGMGTIVTTNEYTYIVKLDEDGIDRLYGNPALRPIEDSAP